jgi:hypothetical protein
MYFGSPLKRPYDPIGRHSARLQRSGALATRSAVC